MPLQMIMRNSVTSRYQAGQSMTEALVALAVLVPLLLVVVSFANLLSTNNAATQAGRFAAWQRTVYQANTSGIGQVAIENRITDNIDRIFVGENPFIDVAQGRNTAVARATVVDTNADVALAVTERNNLVGMDGLQNRDSRLAKCIYRGLSRGSGNACDSAFNRVDAPAINTAVVSIPISRDFSLLKTMQSGGITGHTYTLEGAPPSDRVAGTSRFSVSGHGALLTAGSWAPATPEDMHNAVSAAAHDGRTLETYQGARLNIFNVFSGNWMGTWMGSMLLGLEEMTWMSNTLGRPQDGAHSTVAQGQADVLPPQMGTFGAP
jgi:Tfp pilus assembly protein PilV